MFPWITGNPDSWVHFGTSFPMTIEYTPLPNCVSSFTNFSFHDTLAEQSFHSAHQNPNYHVVVEPLLPRVADDLDGFGERGLGYMIDIEDFSFLDVASCVKGICDFSDQLWERLKCDAHNCSCAITSRNGHPPSASRPGYFLRRRPCLWPDV